MKISGNTIFLPGGTSGIGEALARRLAAAGNTVVVAGRDRDKLARITADDENIVGVELDVTDPAAIESVSDQVQREHPDINVLLTMAGIMRGEDLRTADFLSTAEAEITTNLLGTIRLIGRFTEFLAGKPGATIITVSSGLAHVPMAATPTYSATKSAVHAFSDAMRVQLAPSGIDVVEIVPPAVQTTLMPGQDTAEWAMPLDDFVSETMELLAADGVTEVLVDNVGPLRHAERDGKRDEMIQFMAGLV